MRQCRQCGETKDLESFPIVDKRGLRRRICKACKNAYLMARYREKRGEVQEKNKRDAVSYRTRIYNHYGGKCAHCDEPDWIVLTIDHINDDGGHRRMNGEPKGIAFYRWIERNDYPSDLQLLCRNCNWRKHVKNVQRLSRKGVPSSDGKRPAPHEGEDIV